MAATYPPTHHFLRDLEVVNEHRAAGYLVSRAPVTDFVRNAAGAAALGFVTAVVDVSGAAVALAASAPDWAATADLSLHATGWLFEGPMTVHSRLVRAGSHVVVVDADVFDAHEQRTATGIVTFARIPGSASAASGTFDQVEPGTVRRMEPPDSPLDEPLMDRSGLRVLDAAQGAVEIAHDAYVGNSFGTINGGVLGMLFQAAAECVVGDMVATDVQIHYLRQARQGPARTSAQVLRRNAEHAVCAVEAVDAGDGDRVLARATVTLQRPPD